MSIWCQASALAIVFLAATNTGVHAQATGPQFKSRSELVLVPTIVHNKAGHVSGLKKADFIVLDNGRPREIAVFEEVRQLDVRLQPRQLPPGSFSNSMDADGNRKNLVIIALDSVTTPQLRQAKVRKELLDYLAQAVQGNTIVALVLLRGEGVRVLHDFTRDPKALADALRQLSFGGKAVESTSTNADNAMFCFGKSCSGPRDDAQELSSWLSGELERSLQDADYKQSIFAVLGGLQQLARAVEGLPGRKSLVWIGGGFPFALTGGAVGITKPQGLDLNPERNSTAQVSAMIEHYNRVWKALDQADVALYAIDVNSFVPTDYMDASTAYRAFNETRRQRWLRWGVQNTLWAFASATGGEAYYQVHNVATAYRQALDDSSAYYVLGYYLDRNKDEIGWHELSVKVSAPHADVRSRRGYLVTGKENKADREIDLQLAFASAYDYTGLPVNGAWKSVTREGEKRIAQFQIEVPAEGRLINSAADNQLDLDITAVVRDHQAKDIAHVSRTLQGKLNAQTAAEIQKRGVLYADKFELPPGDFTVRFVVRDNATGRIGSVSTALKIE